MKLSDQYIGLMLVAFCASRLSETWVGIYGFGLVLVVYGIRATICSWRGE